MAAKKFGKYELTAKLGQGGMGSVYAARDPVLDRPVALKVVSPKLLAESDTFQRFQREARAAARLQHPNIVTIYELGEAEGTLYIAMELLEGDDLAQLIHPIDPGRVTDKVRTVVEICRGLDYAHKKGVVHRDVKPANIRTLKDGAVKIMDFGIAHIAGSTLTQSGMVLGTPSYLAPEVIASGRVDHRADIWSVGVLLYEILTGVRPYDSNEFATVLYRIVHEPLPPLGPALGLPDGLEAVVSKALSRDPAKRYQDIAEMGRDLQAVIGMGVTSESLLPPEARQRAFESLWQEAEAFLARGDLEHALESALQAQALDPSRPEIVAIVDRVQDRLYSPEAAEAATTPRLKSPFHERPVPPAAPVAAPAAPRNPTTPFGTPIVNHVKTRGASAFRELATFGEPPATQVALLCPSWPLLATSGTDGAIRLWDLLSHRRVQMLRTELHQRTGHDALALSLAFSPDGTLLASGHVDGSIHLWHLESGSEYPARLRHEEMVGALAFSPDGGVLASGGMDATLKFWDVGAAVAGEARRELHRQPAGVTSIAYAGGGGSVITGHANRIVRVSDAKTGRLVATLRGPEGAVHLLCLTPDGKRLAVASQDRTTRFFDVETRVPVAALPPQRKPTTSLSFFGDGNHLLSVSGDNAVQLWEVDTQSSVASLWGPADDTFAGVALYGEEDHIAVALSDGRVRLWGPA